MDDCKLKVFIICVLFLWCINVTLIAQGIVLLDQNTKAIDGCLYIWKNCLTQIIVLVLVLYRLILMIMNTRISKDICCVITLGMLIVFAWNIYILAYLDTCDYDNYADLLLWFKIACFYNFALVGLTGITTIWHVYAPEPEPEPETPLNIFY